MFNKSKTFVKKTKKGNVFKVVKEHYLRDDIGTGVGEALEKNANCYIIPDTNVVLHQINLLESPLVKNVIILQTVLDETKNQNISLYQRLRALIKKEEKHFYVFSNEHHKDTFIERNENETMNDRNDRAIRVAAKWYMRIVSEGVPIFLITNDRDNLKKALKDEISAKTIKQYINELSTHPELISLLNEFDKIPTDDGPVVGKMNKNEVVFEKHLPLDVLSSGIKSQLYYQGVLRTRRNNSNEATITLSSNKNEDLKDYDSILIKGFKNINRAIDGDLVAFEVFKKEDWGSYNEKYVERGKEEEKEEKEEIKPEDRVPTGKIVGILKRNWRCYCGSIDEDTNENAHKVFFVPIDRKIPRIRIQTRQVKELMTKRITVAIDNWDVNSKFPEGHYVKTLGDIGDPKTESEVILLENEIPHYEFPQNVLDCLPSDDWYITEEMIKERTDFRHLNICSIDPEGCRDIDDALHVKKLKNGNYQVGVHIADVSYFVKEGTPLDDEALNRATTTYLVDQRIDMLPKILTENICSLRSNVDRLAFSVLWEMKSDGTIVDVDFTKSVIRSKASLTYAKAQSMMDDKNNDTKLAQGIRMLNKFAKILKKKREEAGALSLASPQVKFGMDVETLNPTDVEIYQMHETNSLVEEFMLLANITVAKKIYEYFPSTAVLRRHPAPNVHRFDALKKSLSTVNLDLNVNSSKELSQSLDQCTIEGNDYFNVIVRIMTTRCMQEALYFISADHSKEDFRHYGLATPIYTHFTSPIRRYPDVLVHRQLGVAIGIYTQTKQLTDKEQMRNCTGISNKRHTSAQYAGRSSVELYSQIYFKDRSVIEEAYVMKTSPNAVYILIPRYGIEGIVSLDDIIDKIDYDKEKEQIKFSSMKLKIFDKVKAKISVEVSKNFRRKSVISIIDPPVDKLLKGEEIETIQPPTQKRKITEVESTQSSKKKKNKKNK